MFCQAQMNETVLKWRHKMKPELLTIPEFCKSAKVGRTVAYSLINKGEVKAVKLGKKTLIPRSAMDEFIASLPVYKAGNHR